MSNLELDGFREDLIATVYGQAVTKLMILKQSQRLCRSTVLPTVSRKLSQTPSAKYKLHNKNLPSEQLLNDIKLEKELNELIEIYQLAYHALSNPSTALQEAVQMRTQDNNKEANLCQQLKERHIEMKSLKQQTETLELKANERFACTEERISELRHNLKHVRRINNLEVDLVTKWEESRYTQATIVCEKEENAFRQQTALLQQKIEDEQRISCELEAFHAKQFAEYQQQIEEWQHKYAREFMKMEALVQDKQQRIRDLNKTQERHRATYDYRVQLVKMYRQQKAEDQRLYELQLHRLECAVQIQAWWRGTMVRRGLGPFKKKSKKGKKARAK